MSFESILASSYPELREQLETYRAMNPELNIDWDVCDSFVEGLFEKKKYADLAPEFSILISMFYKTLVRVALEKSQCHVCNGKANA